MSTEILNLLVNIFVAFCILFTMIFTGIAAWFKLRESNETRPHIVSLNGFGKNIHLIVTNNKPYNITIKGIKARKKILGPLYSASLPVKWEPSSDVKLAYEDPAKDALARLSALPEYTVVTQRMINIEILKYSNKSTYKISVQTTGGCCSSIYHSPSKRQDE